jgi:hypothetical protein
MISRYLISNINASKIVVGCDLDLPPLLNWQVSHLTAHFVVYSVYQCLLRCYELVKVAKEVGYTCCIIVVLLKYLTMISGFNQCLSAPYKISQCSKPERLWWFILEM